MKKLCVDNFFRGVSLLLVATSICLLTAPGCRLSNTQPEGLSTANAALIMDGSILESATSVRLWVFDIEVQGCNSEDHSVDDPRATSLFASDSIFPDSEGAFGLSFEVPEGRRTFYVEVYGQEPGLVIATGCSVDDVWSTGNNRVTVRIYSTEPTDADETPEIADVTADDLSEDIPSDILAEDAPDEDGPSDTTDIEAEYDCNAIACTSLDWHEYFSVGASVFGARSSISKTIAVDDCCLVIEDISIAVDLLHGNIGDLTLRIERPDGVAFPIHKRQGGTSDNIIGEYPVTLTPTVDLCLLTGGDSYGTWSLILRNDGGFSGTLNGWTLKVKGEPERCRGDAFYPIGPFPTAIPDNDAFGTASTLNVTADFTLTAVEVHISITHDNIGDLIITLVSPTGTRCILHNRTGSGSDDIITYYPDPTTPSESLAVFNGERSPGVWTLEVVDFTSVPSSLQGELNGWILYLH
jgi:subtilisin-like proprotein convertase family protein